MNGPITPQVGDSIESSHELVQIDYSKGKSATHQSNNTPMDQFKVLAAVWL